MDDRQINKWLRRRFTVVGWVLVAYYIIMNIMAVVTLLGDSLAQLLRALAEGKVPFAADRNAAASNAWGYLISIAIALVVLYAWKGSDFFRVELRVKNGAMTAGTFFCVLSLCVGAQMVNGLWITGLEWFLNRFGLSALGILESVSGQSDSFSMFLYSALAAPVVEEILFRGFVLRSLRPFGKRFAILGSALLFGLFHGNLLQTPYAFLVGLVLGYVTVEYSLFWAIVLHLFNNLVLADLLTRLTSLLPQMAGDLVSLLVVGGFALAGIVILALRRREVRAYRQSEWMDRRVLLCFFTNSGVIVLTVLMVMNMILVLFV